MTKWMSSKKIFLDKFRLKNKKLKEFRTLSSLKQSLKIILVKKNQIKILDSRCLIKLYIRRKSNSQKEEKMQA